jgi:2-polyprenyl-6-methoxyphenol hydroxylase-like FAD-dependent oxidoreductase
VFYEGREFLMQEETRGQDIQTPPQAVRVVIVGGSLAGLFTGLVLLREGYDVQVFEKSSSALQDRGAGLVVQPEVEQILEQYCATQIATLSTHISWRRYLTRNGGILREDRAFQRFVSWNSVYRQLRHAFPDGRYHMGHTLTSFTQTENEVVVRFLNGKEIASDLVVFADGTNSTGRHLLFPQVTTHYAGYIAWRGVVPEHCLSPESTHAFADTFAFYQMPSSHILGYLIPGQNGELTPGTRRLNWVWYVNIPPDTLEEVMTDRDGIARTFSVPPGAVREAQLRIMREQAQQLLPRAFADLTTVTTEPFIQPIYDIAVPHMVVGKALLLGDAASVPRPHTAASTAKAAADALALGEWLRSRPDNMPMALAQWAQHQGASGAYLQRLGQSLGNRSQFSL